MTLVSVGRGRPGGANIMGDITWEQHCQVVISGERYGRHELPQLGNDAQSRRNGEIASLYRQRSGDFDAFLLGVHSYATRTRTTQEQRLR